jgi:hypothetical protein
MLGGLVEDVGGVCAGSEMRAPAPPCVATSSAAAASALTDRFTAAPFSARFDERAVLTRRIAQCPAIFGVRSQNEERTCSCTVRALWKPVATSNPAFCGNVRVFVDASGRFVIVIGSAGVVRLMVVSRAVMIADRTPCTFAAATVSRYLDSHRIKTRTSRWIRQHLGRL